MKTSNTTMKSRVDLNFQISVPILLEHHPTNSEGIFQMKTTFNCFVLKIYVWISVFFWWSHCYEKSPPLRHMHGERSNQVFSKLDLNRI